MPPAPVRSSASLRNLFDSRPLFHKQPLDLPSAGQRRPRGPFARGKGTFPIEKLTRNRKFAFSTDPKTAIKPPPEVVHFEVTIGGAF